MGPCHGPEKAFHHLDANAHGFSVTDLPNCWLGPLVLHEEHAHLHRIVSPMREMDDISDQLKDEYAGLFEGKG